MNDHEPARAHAVEVAKLKVDARKNGSEPVDTSLWAPERVAGSQESLFQDFDAPPAVLRIDRPKIEVPILPGTDEVTLNRGVGW